MFARKPILVCAWLLAAFLVGPVSFSCSKASAGVGSFTYLTWDGDPSRTMVVSLLSDAPDAGFCEWRAAGAEVWARASASRRDFPFLPGWKVWRAELCGLDPGSRYEFRWANLPGVRSFSTAPADLRKPLTFVDGGDVYIDGALMDAMNSLVARQSPLFVVLGGDLAYANGDPLAAERWVAFMRSFSEKLVAPDGRSIPMLVANGNHDSGRPYLREGEAYRPPKNPKERRAAAAYLEALFPCFADKSYRAVDFGNYLSLVLLDSRHLSDVRGAQAEWLARALEARRGVPHLFPVYHVPAYPSAKLESTAVPELIRAHWVPLFERSGVKLAFEHDSHTFKVTRPIKAGKVDPDGVVYLGDGAWGVPPRPVERAKQLWYISKAEATNNAHVVTLYPDKRTVRSIDITGRELSRIEQSTNIGGDR